MFGPNKAIVHKKSPRSHGKLWREKVHGDIWEYIDEEELDAYIGLLIFAGFKDPTLR